MNYPAELPDGRKCCHFGGMFSECKDCQNKRPSCPKSDEKKLSANSGSIPIGFGTAVKTKFAFQSTIITIPYYLLSFFRRADSIARFYFLLPAKLLINNPLIDGLLKLTIFRKKLKLDPPKLFYKVKLLIDTDHMGKKPNFCSRKELLPSSCHCRTILCVQFEQLHFQQNLPRRILAIVCQ